MIIQVIPSITSLTLTSTVVSSSWINHTAVADEIHSRAWMFASMKKIGFSSFLVIFMPLIGRPSKEFPIVKISVTFGNSEWMSSRYWRICSYVLYSAKLVLMSFWCLLGEFSVSNQLKLKTNAFLFYMTQNDKW